MTHDEHKVEGQIRLFYNEFTREWKTVALPQYIWSAGHTREVEEDDPIKSKIIETLLNSGFGQAGTGHHHSGMSAFQSGGDKEDELGQNGFHFAVGQMSSPTADFHCRATFRKINYDPNQGMLDPNQWVPGLHNQVLQKDIAALWLSLSNLPPFPEEWKTYLRKKPVQTPVATTRNWTRLPTTARVIMYQDRFFCITFKPSKIQHTFRILPKPKTHAAPVTPITPATPTQAKINQQKLAKLEAQKKALPQNEESYDELVNRISQMNEAEYATFCQNLRAEGKVRAAKRVIDGGAPNPAAARINTLLQESLAEFRDAYTPDDYSARDLENLCDAIQELSALIVNGIEDISRLHGPFLAKSSPDELRALLITWSSLMFENILTDVFPGELELICEECRKPKNLAVNFYNTMCQGLRQAMLNESIDPIYENDGTISAIIT